LIRCLSGSSSSKAGFSGISRPQQIHFQTLPQFSVHPLVTLAISNTMVDWHLGHRFMQLLRAGDLSMDIHSGTPGGKNQVEISANFVGVVYS
jgi:hypothetical protein